MADEINNKKNKNENDDNVEKKNFKLSILPFLNQYYYKTTYIFNNINTYKNDIFLDFILGYGILRINNILLNNSFNNTFIIGITIFYIYIWEHWFILAHHSDLVGFPETINWFCQIIKYGTFMLTIFCIREDVLTEIKKPNSFFNLFIILLIIIRLYSLLTYLMANPGPNKIYSNLNLQNDSNISSKKYPIFNKKNWIERFSMLTILTLVFPLTFIPSLNFSITFHDITYTLIIGVILISIGYLYNSVNNVLAINHAINLISPFFGSMWRFLHLSLHLGISLVGLALTDIIKNIYVYRNYPNNSYDETLSPSLPTLPTTYYSGLEKFYQSEKFRSISAEAPPKYKNANLGKAIHSIDEIKVLLAMAFLLTFISVFLMKFLHKYSTSAIINDSVNNDNNKENIEYNKKKNKEDSPLSSKTKDTKESSVSTNIIKSSNYASDKISSDVQNDMEAVISSETNCNINNSNSNISSTDDQLNTKKFNFYKLNDNLKNSIIDLANNKKFASPEAHDIINKCSNEKIANNIMEMNNNAVITTYVNNSLTIISFFIFLFQILLILPFLVFNYMKIPISVLLILTFIIVEIELLSELLLPRVLNITKKGKNIKILKMSNDNNIKN
ncbi:hypothetical protein H8356DRAFT_940017 [Neocallimastix lanati (nom. inval.)]|uniref:Uncharacterized protein n=1 Tax=Neocallimastix californiae TaxID=1754190 RepID=A0A1Y2EQH6_9FUNG|nr:hypothetical protein H8356DRAFT_940017 [Neocallimastix sp. JGI-2020a]ORY73787.1 hypothetical protein LY90DRAFT_666538 [Neocallimastix californiae]|eukprot:ORY73787.1 hypothetical protein LY90DRAFT_666538 [Neocallimastix californiae]